MRRDRQHAELGKVLGMISAVALALAATPVLAATEDELTSEPTAAEAPAAAPAPATAPAKAPVEPAVVNAPELPKSLQRPEASTGSATIRYSRRQKQGVAGTAPAAPAGGSGAAAAHEVICQAGCEGPVGQIVYVPEASSSPVAHVAPAPGQTAAAATEAVTCVAGCYGNLTFAATAATTESTYLTTQGKLPKAGAASGEWLVKINRERGAAEPRR